MITGDWDRLQATVRGLQKLSTVPARAASAAARGIGDEIDRQFAEKRDPYGKAWAPHMPATVARWGQHDLLRLTGSGQSEIEVKPAAGAGIEVTSPSMGLAFAQGGTKYEKPRRFLPTDQMPKTWRRIIEEAVESEFRKDLSEASR